MGQHHAWYVVSAWYLLPLIIIIIFIIIIISLLACVYDLSLWWNIPTATDSGLAGWRRGRDIQRTVFENYWQSKKSIRSESPDLTSVTGDPEWVTYLSVLLFPHLQTSGAERDYLWIVLFSTSNCQPRVSWLIYALLTLEVLYPRNPL